MPVIDKKVLGKYFEAVILRGVQEAQQDGSATVEAQHLLLGVAAQDGTEPQRILRAAGLDHDGIRAALDREFEQSLAVAGVTASIADLPPVPRFDRKPGLGATGKLAIERMATSTTKRELRPQHLLLGILLAEVGTVPRLLAVAGVDRTELIAAVRDSLDSAR
ncbi:Clp protease N-terminal domain-containing protein [Nocardia sp. NPDC020380]|uniref:Clp protease N-terminal domain-containing protein n=1 Tax=Nocardia sp. NPDC020380 TaxID=3364309 RepID=UPI0037AE73A5